MSDSGVPKDLLKKLNNDERGEISIAVSIEGKKLRIDFGKQIEWIAFDMDHLDIFLALVNAKRREMLGPW